MAAKALVVFSGCGVFDGTEIHEAVVMLLTLSQQGVEVQCAAPDIPQVAVVDHAKGQEADQQRQVLGESARIARGEILPLAEARAQDYDALFFPGGFGAARNLTSFAADGPSCSIDPDVQRVVREFHAAGKPICAVCIAPAVLARALGQASPLLTIGDDAATAAALEAMGARHQACVVTECVTDADNKIVTAPAYMLPAPLRDVARGVAAAVEATLSLSS